jgi:DeoR family fructose operon transcriptional repressor
MNATESSRSLKGLIRRLGGLDFCFVGANGLTASDGITMPTALELPTKLELIARAGRAFVVADASKFGKRFPFIIADWQAKVTVITNTAVEHNPDLEEVLRLGRRVDIEFAA